MARTVYSIKKNRLRRSYGDGFVMDGAGNLYLDENSPTHRLYLTPIDSAENDSEWGRLSFKVRLSEEQVLYVYAFATNEKELKMGEEMVNIERFVVSDGIQDSAKKLLYNNPEAKRFVDKNDVLLYDLKGRYLFVCIEILGLGGGMLYNIRAERGSDEFIDAFPEVYRENNDFFRRYISVFNSIYNDFESSIERLPELLNFDKCPDELLPTYASWLGIDVQGDFMKPEALRQLVKEAYILNRMKGTKECLKRLLTIALEETPIILEANQMKEYAESEGEGVFDVTVLVKKQFSENERFQLMYLLEQFMPVRCRLKIETLKDNSILDNRVYLDMNAQVQYLEDAKLDEYMSLDGQLVLEE
ncbi:MAG: hypothetical protein IKO61_12395 [Lachnospiraceae bacterium]|nr:hypothetical protein [Lachnospiraceae bacterium]